MKRARAALKTRQIEKLMDGKGVTLGVISDTHGLLRPEAFEALRRSDRILHAGDVGNPDILEALSQIAPVTAVRGNVDNEPWARGLPATEVVEVAGVPIYMLHNLGTPATSTTSVAGR